MFSPDAPKALRHSIRSKASVLRLLPTLPDWFVMRVQLRTGDRWWLAVPPVEYRWALIGAYLDRLGHAGISQTLAFIHQHFHWPGIKADIEAFIRQCHACQVRRLKLQDMAHVGLPRMSGPFEHVHIDLAGPFELRAVADK